VRSFGSSLHRRRNAGGRFFPTHRGSAVPECKSLPDRSPLHTLVYEPDGFEAGGIAGRTNLATLDVLCIAPTRRVVWDGVRKVILIILLFTVAGLYLIGRRVLLTLLAWGAAGVALVGLMFGLAWSMDKQVPLQWLDSCAEMGRHAAQHLAGSIDQMLH
jgi:hypothetical protein